MDVSPPPPPRAFRWIRAGEAYRYSPRLGTGLDERKGEGCIVLIIGRPGSAPVICLVKFADGYQTICRWGVLRPMGNRQ